MLVFFGNGLEELSLCVSLGLVHENMLEGNPSDQKKLCLFPLFNYFQLVNIVYSCFHWKQCTYWNFRSVSALAQKILSEGNICMRVSTIIFRTTIYLMNVLADCLHLKLDAVLHRVGGYFNLVEPSLVASMQLLTSLELIQLMVPL